MIEWFFGTFGTVGGYIIIGSVLVLTVAIIWFNISKSREKKRDDFREHIGEIKRTEQVIKGVNQRTRVNSGEVPVAEPEPVKDSGISVRVDEEKQQASAEVFAKVRKSRKKHQPTEIELAVQKYGEHMVVNGYRQKSDTAPIRPVYSNTAKARKEQKAELESDEVGEEATTPAIVTDSAAPAKVKPTELKPPTSAHLRNQQHAEESYVKDAIRPVIGSSVANSVPERPAEVPEEMPEIATGEEKPIPTAKTPVKGFAPAKKAQVKRPKSEIQQKNEEAIENTDLGE